MIEWCSEKRSSNQLSSYQMPNSPYCMIYLWWETERENWSWSLGSERVKGTFVWPYSGPRIAGQAHTFVHSGATIAPDWFNNFRDTLDWFRHVYNQIHLDMKGFFYHSNYSYSGTCPNKHVCLIWKNLQIYVIFLSQFCLTNISPQHFCITLHCTIMYLLNFGLIFIQCKFTYIPYTFQL